MMNPPVSALGCLPVQAMFIYGGAVAAAIARTKGGSLPDLSALLPDLADRLARMTLGEAPVAMIAVPPNRKRLVQRGLHLPDLLAGGLARQRTAWHVVRALERTDEFAPRRSDRASAPHFATRVAGEGRTALLIDDVVTTGATLAAAAEVLVAGGWRVCGALCLADARTAAIASTF
jgi:predicted amidophosphoribosyltransferase